MVLDKYIVISWSNPTHVFKQLSRMQITSTKYYLNFLENLSNELIVSYKKKKIQKFLFVLVLLSLT